MLCTQLPIRRQSHPSPAKTIDAIKQELETYAIMFPNVSFTLQDDSKSRDNDSSKGHVLRVPRVRETSITMHDIPLNACPDRLVQF